MSSINQSLAALASVKANSTPVASLKAAEATLPPVAKAVANVAPEAISTLPVANPVTPTAAKTPLAVDPSLPVEEPNFEVVVMTPVASTPKKSPRLEKFVESVLGLPQTSPTARTAEAAAPIVAPTTAATGEATREEQSSRKNLVLERLGLSLGAVTVLTAAGVVIGEAVGLQGLNLATVVTSVGILAIALLAAIVITVKEWLASRQVAQIQGPVQGCENNLEATARGAARVEREVRNELVTTQLKDKVNDTIQKAREASSKLKTRNFGVSATALKELNDQIGELRAKFAESALVLGFSEALEILNTEFAADAELNTEGLEISKATGAAVNLRDLILFGKKDVYNITNPGNTRNLIEINKAVLPGIQEDISSLMATRFVKSVCQDADAAIAQFTADSKKAKKTNAKINADLQTAGVNLQVILDKAREKVRNQLSLNSLVTATVEKFIASKEINRLDLGTDVTILGEELKDVIKFCDKTIARFVSKVNNEIASYRTRVAKKDAEDVAAEEAARLAALQASAATQLADLTEGVLSNQHELITSIEALNKARKTLAALGETIPAMHASAARVNQGGEIVPLDGLQTELVGRANQLRADIVRLEARIAELNQAIVDKNAAINGLQEQLSENRLTMPDLMVDFASQTAENKKAIARVSVEEAAGKGADKKAPVAETLAGRAYQGDDEFVQEAPKVSQRRSRLMATGARRASLAGLNY